MRQIKWNNVVIPSPTNNWTIVYEDISDEETGRCVLTGDMDKKILSRKRTTKWEWKAIPDEYASLLLKNVKGTSYEIQEKTYGTLTCPDALLGKDDEIKMYSGPAECTFLFQKNNVCYWDIKMDFIEV
jgi:hypothetical protein